MRSKTIQTEKDIKTAKNIQTKKTTKKKNVRRAVLSKPLSVFYRIEKSTIEVLAILDNRCDFEVWI